MYLLEYHTQSSTPWNKGKLVGQRPPLKLREIWAVHVRLQLAAFGTADIGIDDGNTSCPLTGSATIETGSRASCVSDVGATITTPNDHTARWANVHPHRR